MKKRMTRGVNSKPKAPLFEIVIESAGKMPIVKLNGELVKNKKQVHYLFEGSNGGGQKLRVEHYERDNGKPILKTDQISSRMVDFDE